MIIDCHGHYTTAPPELQAFRDAQLAHFEDPSRPKPRLEQVSDTRSVSPSSPTSYAHCASAART